MVVDVNWNTNKQWQWKCFKIADVLMPALNPQPKDGKIINIRHMKFQNKYVDPIYIDELRIGKIRGSSFNMIQTKKALSFDGQVPKKFNIWRNFLNLNMLIPPISIFTYSRVPNKRTPYIYKFQGFVFYQSKILSLCLFFS